MKFNYAKAVSRPLETSLFLGVALGALCVPAMASAQTAPAPKDAIIVTGLRASLEDALEIRRNADVVLDGISADDIGSTPDLNLGEALQRIPGVQINREENRRDATISVRGLPGNFSKTTVQGQSIASTNRGINFTAGNPFGIFDSSIFNGANVVKSFTGDTPSGGLAAVVDLRINSAFKRREGVVLRAEVNFEESTEQFVPAYFGSFAKKLTDRFAVYGTVAYTKLDFRRDALRVNAYSAFTQAQVDGFAAGTRATGLGSPDTITRTNVRNEAFAIPAVGENGLNNRVVFPQNPNQFVQQDRGNRVSGAAGFAYELNDNLTFRVDGIYTRRELESTTQDNLNTGLNGTNSLVTPLSDPVFLGTFDFNEDGIEENVYNTPRVFVSDPLISHSNRFLPALEQSFGIYPQINFENDDWRLDIIGTYSEATGVEQLENYDFRPAAITGGAPDANNDGIDDRGFASTVLIDTALGDLDRYFFDARIDPRLLDFSNATLPIVIQGGNGGQGGINIPITFTSANGNTITAQRSFLLQGFNSEINRDLKAIDIDLARKFENSVISEIAIGGYYSQENSDRQRLQFGPLGANVAGLIAEDVAPNLFIPNGSIDEGAGFLGGDVPGAERDNFVSVNIDLVRDTLLPVTRAIPEGATFALSAADLRNSFPEIVNDPARPEVGAGSITLAEFLAAVEEVPRSGGFLSRLNQANIIGGGNGALANNFTSDRENIELYGMAKFNLENVSDVRLRGNFGLRYINTDLSGQTRSVTLDFIDRINALRTAAGTPLLELREGARRLEPGQASFSRFLPSVNLIYDITPKLTARAAYYETFEAFDLAEFQPTPTTIAVIEPGEDPEDLTAASPTTVVSLSSLDVKPRSSKGFDLGLSWYNRKGSVIALGFFRKTLENDITTFRNFCPAGESFTALGQTFSDLLIDGNRCTFDVGDGTREFVRISFSANNPDNVTVTGFEAQIQQNLDFLPGPLKHTGFTVNATRVRSSGPNDVQLTRVADFTYNLIGYYEDDLLQARLAWNHQSEIQLGNGGSFGGGARRVAPRGQLDFSGAIKPSKSFEVRFEVFNITKSPRREFTGVEALFRNYQFDGRTYGLSATYRFN